MVWIPDGEKKFEDIKNNRFDRIPACNRQTDVRTDRQTSCGPHRNTAIPFGTEKKLEWSGYPIVKKLFDRIPPCDRRTDGRTDRQTDGQTSYHGIVRAMHTRRAVKATEWCGYTAIRRWKPFQDMITRFDTIHECDGQQAAKTDGRTDGQTDTARRRRPRLQRG